MKKLVSFVMATVLCLGMTTAVMAAPSADTGTSSPDVDNSKVVEVVKPTGDVTGVDAEGNAVTVTLTGYELAGIPDDSDSAVVWANSVLGDSTPEVDTVVTTYVEDGFAGTVAIPVTGVTDKDTVKAFIDNQDGTFTAVEKAVAKNGVVEVTNAHFCPVVILVDTYEAPAYIPPLVFPTESTSPKTADASLMVTMLAVVALAGVVVATRKVKASK